MQEGGYKKRRIIRIKKKKKIHEKEKGRKTQNSGLIEQNSGARWCISGTCGQRIHSISLFTANIVEMARITCCSCTRPCNKFLEGIKDH